MSFYSIWDEEYNDGMRLKGVCDVYSHEKMHEWWKRKTSFKEKVQNLQEVEKNYKKEKRMDEKLKKNEKNWGKEKKYQVEEWRGQRWKNVYIYVAYMHWKRKSIEFHDQWI